MLIWHLVIFHDSNIESLKKVSPTLTQTNENLYLGHNPFDSPLIVCVYKLYCICDYIKHIDLQLLSMFIGLAEILHKDLIRINCGEANYTDVGSQRALGVCMGSVIVGMAAGIPNQR